MTYKTTEDKSIKELIKESKKQRKNDRRKGYLRAVREIRGFADKKIIIYPSYELVMQKLNRMEGDENRRGGHF